MKKPTKIIIAVVAVLAIIAGLVWYANYNHTTYPITPENPKPGATFTMAWKRFGGPFNYCGYTTNGEVNRISNNTSDDFLISRKIVEQALNIGDLNDQTLNDSEIAAVRSRIQNYLQTSPGFMEVPAYQALLAWKPNKFYIEDFGGCLPGTGDITLWSTLKDYFIKHATSGTQGIFQVLAGTPSDEYIIQMEDLDGKIHAVKVRVGE